MYVNVPLENGLLPDRYGKFAPDDCKRDGHPIVSFPIEIARVPMNTRSLALVFIDFDAIPVGGFCWIHWLACNIDPNTKLIPENASQDGSIAMVQGSNSSWSPMTGGTRGDVKAMCYTGPYPPDKTHIYTLDVYALDCMLDLPEGYYLSDFRKAIRGHVLEKVEVEFPSRAD